jgi:hypothetical protein
MCDRPAQSYEIDVTPEMVDAGAVVIYSSNEIDDIGPTGAKNLAFAVIKAALEARSRGNFEGGGIGL